jgi:hypothetical protein
MKRVANHTAGHFLICCCKVTPNFCSASAAEQKFGVTFMHYLNECPAVRRQTYVFAQLWKNKYQEKAAGNPGSFQTFAIVHPADSQNLPAVIFLAGNIFVPPPFLANFFPKVSSKRKQAFCAAVFRRFLIDCVPPFFPMLRR